ncbi:polysaccharide biosynthesis/export family protein [Aquabacter sp. CN5-332]|uniref:polysaccharide biosynthesis/export family protein n=1 Tax=Aquabacter sp. CN5-332 TaxID=3156608 RepID=UPI0032B606C3
MAAAGMEYRLGPEDRIRLKVYEWRASQDQIFEWEALGAEFTVGAEGNLSIPLVGEVPAEGLMTSEIARSIGERLKARMGLLEPPDTAVEVVLFRPFFVSGEVAKPGPYPFKPGLTVLQATAIAGGVLRPSDAGLMRLGRDAIAAEGDISLLNHETDALRGRRARLQAELKDATEIEFPAELKRREAERPIILLMQQEQLIFQARNEALKAQADALAELKTFLGKEAESLKAQLVTQDKQLALVSKELEGVATLVEKGYVITPRQLALERGIAQIQGDRLRLETELLRVRQEASKTDIALIELRNKRVNEVTLDLRDTQAKLEQIEHKTVTGQKLLYEAEVIAPRLLADHIRGRRLLPTYVIVRQVDGRPVEIQASETTLVEPGDTVKIDLPLPGDGPPVQAAETAPAVAGRSSR